MFKVGDLIVYSSHGVCRIYNIKEKIFLGEKKNYYERVKIYSDILKSGKREDISLILNTLVTEGIKISKIDKKLNEKDKKILSNIEEILFEELSYALDITSEEVKSKVYKIIKSRVK